jgi:hypothetical protein
MTSMKRTGGMAHAGTNGDGGPTLAKRYVRCGDAKDR